jgi:hypothetical protein
MRIKVPSTSGGKFLFFFVSQYILYGLIVANTRAFTQALYCSTAITDGLIALQGFFTVRLIAKDENSDGIAPLLGTVVGGVAGSLSSIFLTKMLYGR